MPSLNDIRAARDRIRPYLTLPTPLERAAWLGEQVYLKVETVNPTHSFKIRGALNALLARQDSGAAGGGVITASSGNHAQALAYAAKLTGVRAQILMPKPTPQKKVDGVRAHGGEAILFGDVYDEAEAEAIRRAHAEGIPYLSAYAHPDVVAGAGTVGLEIAAQLPSVRRALVCLGGGGLISGIVSALAHLAPECEVIGVCAQHAPAGYNAKYGTHLPQVWDTLAEALSGDIEADSLTLDCIRQRVQRVVLVSEEAIADAMRALAYRQGWVAEGGGAVAVAALLSGVVEPSSQPTVAVVSGGNVDADRLRRILAG
jgi:threonine dehydratase